MLDACVVGFFVCFKLFLYLGDPKKIGYLAIALATAKKGK